MNVVVRGADETKTCSPLSDSFAVRTAAVSLCVSIFLFSGVDLANARQPDVRRVNVTEFIQRYCIDCHNRDDKAGGLDLQRMLPAEIDSRSEIWEMVVRKLRARQMPPLNSQRPTENEYKSVVSSLVSSLDESAEGNPNPGRNLSMRRLTRTEYQNAIRDLLALDVDVAALLPADESSHGFDNVTVGELSPTLLNRYVSAAQKISRLAVGGATRSPGGDTFRLKADITQEEHVDGLPIGTRGGALIPYTFPQDGEYEVRIRLARDRNEEVEGLRGVHQLELLLDRQRKALFSVEAPRDKDFSLVDAHLQARIDVTAGPHKIGVTFLKKPSLLLETKRQPYHAHFNMHRHPRLSPAVYQVSITGPYDAKGPGDTPSRRRVFGDQLEKLPNDETSVKQILTTIMRRAYRRPISGIDLKRPMAFYRQARENGNFDYGIELALSSILINPSFLFRVERDPDGLGPNKAYRISDLELASRLSFFLWSSIPDDELLDMAVKGQLRQPHVLEKQVRRMLQDERSASLTTNFASQWLHLRNLETTTRDLRMFPDFDDNLRQAFRQETELFFESIVHEDRGVLDLLNADYTFLNERLAKHYAIPHIYGSRFRRVRLDSNSRRGGLLRHGSILAVTSYATRTSPVIRGHWVLENLLGCPPPPPPANVPALKDETVLTNLPIRERLAAHRDNAACASCHNLMDPVGFALENFDAVGRWRERESGRPIDASGTLLPGGKSCDGVTGLEQALLDQPELFVGTFVEKLITYALGRGVEHFDAPAVRKIVRGAKESDYRFSSLVLGIVSSTPFQMRTTE